LNGQPRRPQQSPVERGQTEQVARDTVAEAFPRRLLHEVQRLLGKTGGGDGGE
jgi:hypothetical protein